MNPNDPAFPLPGHLRESLGLTKREWFAGMAMGGILSGISGIMTTDKANLRILLETTPEAALKMADMLIAKLSEQEGK